MSTVNEKQLALHFENILLYHNHQLADGRDYGYARHFHTSIYGHILHISWKRIDLITYPYYRSTGLSIQVWYV